MGAPPFVIVLIVSSFLSNPPGGWVVWKSDARLEVAFSWLSSSSYCSCSLQPEAVIHLGQYFMFDGHLQSCTWHVPLFKIKKRDFPLQRVF
jgi:hypothetical protein